MTNKTIDQLDALASIASDTVLMAAAAASDTIKRTTVGSLTTYLEGVLPSGGAEVLTADRTYYVRTDGSNSNTGLANTSGGAFLTIQKACNVVASLVTAGFFVTINIADGTYSETVQASFPLSSTTVSIVGNTTTPGNVIVDNFQVLIGKVYAAGFESLDSVQASYGAYVNAEFFRAIGISCDFSGSADIGDWTQTGDGLVASRVNSSLTLYGTTTISGTPAYTQQFAYAADCGVITAVGSFSGSATGQRYLVSRNGVIYTGGAGATYFPGNVAGVEETGGKYL